MKVLWQVCTSAPLLHHSAPHRFGPQSLNFLQLSSACHAILSVSRKMGDDRKKRSRSRSRDKKRKDRCVFLATIVVQLLFVPMDSLLKPLGLNTSTTISSVTVACFDLQLVPWIKSTPKLLMSFPQNQNCVHMNDDSLALVVRFSNSLGGGTWLGPGDLYSKEEK